MRNGLKKALILLMAACTLFLCAPAAAVSMHDEIENDALDMDVEVGFNGMMTYGKAMPVRVKVRNFGEDFEGVLAVNAYVSAKEYDRFEKEIFVPASSEREFELAVSVYTRQKSFTAELVKDGETVCAVNGQPGSLVNPSALLVGVVSTRPQNLKNMNIDRDSDVLGRFELWQTVPLTADNFPEDAALLNSFGMIVFDDIDPATLTARQQELLDSWLRSGRILVCGGGANAGRNTAFFGKYTGLKLENVTTSDSVLENLEKLLGRSESGRKPTAAVAEYSGGEPLAKDAEGRGLIYRTEAGAGRIYTTAFETGDPKLNSEGLMGYFWQQMLVNTDREIYEYIINNSSDGYSSATVNAGYYAQIEARSFLLPGMLIVFAALVLACVCWAVLKKKDKRQWMWLVLPVLAAVAAAGILLLSTGAETTRPLAVVAENLVQDGSGVIRNYSGISVAVPEYGRHSYSVPGGDLRVMVYDYVDYDEEQEDDKAGEPVTLRTCYKAGGEKTVNAESLAPWDMISLAAENPAGMQGRISGTVWMEEDGLHGEILNETDARFEAGHIITSYGYVSVAALAPGESTEFRLVRMKMDPKTNRYEDGGLYPDHPGLYSVTSNALGYDESNTGMSGREARDREMASTMISGAADLLRKGQGNWSYGAYESALFLYCARPAETAETELKVDGIPVKQKTSMTLLTAELQFSAVGRTGIVFRSSGMDVPDRVEIDREKMPTGETVQNAKQMYYHQLDENPTFLFRLGGMEGVKVEKLQVLIESYYVTQCRVYALNAEKQEWEEIKANEDIQDPGRYVNGDGKLYVQFRSASQDMYADVCTPMITLEGRQEHAGN